MIGDGAVEARGGIGDLEHIGEEGHELEGLGGEGFSARQPVGVAMKQLGVMGFSMPAQEPDGATT